MSVKVVPKREKRELNAQVVSRLLIACILLLIIGAGVGSWYIQQALRDQALAANHAKIDAELSQTELQHSKVLQTYLEQHNVAMQKAKAVVSETKAYQYQNQIVEDVQSYASKAGVTILSFTFPVVASNALPDATGLKSVTAILTLDSPLDYAKYIKFIKYIEQNVTKMQIVSINITPNPRNANTILDPSLQLKVYVR